MHHYDHLHLPVISIPLFGIHTRRYGAEAGDARGLGLVMRHNHVSPRDLRLLGPRVGLGVVHQRTIHIHQN